MGNVLISLDDDKERRLRQLASERFGGKKGSLSAIVAEGIDQIIRKDRKERAMRHQLELMRTGFAGGVGSKPVYANRGELYDR